MDSFLAGIKDKPTTTLTLPSSVKGGMCGYKKNKKGGGINSQSGGSGCSECGV